jgi:CRP-like cAMP-binding protein
MRNLDSYLKVFQPGETVVAEDSFDQRLMVLKAGTLEVSKGGTVIKHIDQPGTLLGEMSYLTNGRRTAKLRAVTRCELNILDQKLDVVIRHFPAVAEKIMSSLVERVLAHEKSTLELLDANRRLQQQVDRLMTSQPSTSTGDSDAGT